MYAQTPDHPILTEVFTDPPGANDAPVGRDPGNSHQEYLELYLPPAAGLNPSLNKDALRLAFYEVEGDISSSGYRLVNYRIDLPTFDLDLSNGLTAGAVARPSSGVIVVGWVDYVGNPPTGLAGTPSTRVALINGGVSSTSGYTFVALNGAQFGGTTNFSVPAAISLINMPNEASSGIIQNGSAAYLLVNRDSTGYVELYDDEDATHVPPGENADPSLDTGTVLATTALSDGFAANDDSEFDVFLQPYPADGVIDLDLVLPQDGAFSLLLAQVPETGSDPLLPAVANGYARLFVDSPKTSETGAADDPVVDATTAYRHVHSNGPFYPTPGFAALTTSPPDHSVAAAADQVFELLFSTTGRPGVLAASTGGDFPINLSASGGASSNPTAATFGAGLGVTGVPGQTVALPSIAITAGVNAAHLATANATVTVTATNTNGGDPPVVSPTRTTTATATVLRPTTGKNASNGPLQTTVFLAVLPIVDSPSTLNEFRASSLGAYLAAQPDITALHSRGNGPTLINASTDISSASVTPLMVADLPDFGEECTTWRSDAGPPGRLSLAHTVLQSAENAVSPSTYAESISTCDATTVIRARRLNHPDTDPASGDYTPSEFVFFADSQGAFGQPRSGLSNATTSRTFELALLDTNVRGDGTVETGQTDDFGLIIEVAGTEASSSVLPGEFVFLSLSGGYQGADVEPRLDATDVLLYVYLFDLDNLRDVLGISSVEAIYVVDAGASGSLDPIEVFSLNAAPGFLANSNPASGESLPRSNGNTIRLTFSANIAAPVPGEVLIQPMLSGGAFGADVSAGFTFTVENNQQGNPRILKVVDVDPPNLNHRQWYSFRSIGGWAGGGIFEVQYMVQIGDANGDGGVFNFDAGVINGGIPDFGAADQDRRDIDGDGTILNDDISIMNVRIPSFPVAKPSGH